MPYNAEFVEHSPTYKLKFSAIRQQHYKFHALGARPKVKKRFGKSFNPF